MMKSDAPPLTPGFILETMKQHAVPWWLTTEDLPDPNNRVTLENATPLSLSSRREAEGSAFASVLSPSPSLAGPHPADDTDPTHAGNQNTTVSIAPPGRIRLSYTPNNVESFKRLQSRWLDVLKRAGHADMSVPLHAYFKKRIPLEGVGHQNGTCRMGLDPATSVLDANCKAHSLDNLYVVDASCFPSASAVNPSLTIVANSLRVAAHVLDTRLT
jgi:choline dehydrogenase-like flavoprotein